MRAEWFTDYEAQPVPLDSEGYDECGTYWGVDAPLWCVTFTFEGKEYSDHARGYLKVTAIEAVKAINAKRLYAPS